MRSIGQVLFVATLAGALNVVGPVAASAYDDWDIDGFRNGCGQSNAKNIWASFYVGPGPYVWRSWFNTGAPNYHHLYIDYERNCDNPSGCFTSESAGPLFGTNPNAFFTSSEIGGMGDVYHTGIACSP